MKLDSKHFMVDISFTGVIKEWFDQLDISFVVIGLDENKSIKPEHILTRTFKTDDILIKFPAKLGLTGNIEPKKKTCIIFDEQFRSQVEEEDKEIFVIDYYPNILFFVKVISPNGNTYYTFNKITQAKINEALEVKEV